jgi:antitoxin component of RelBE/YafQ-DinJ toxin-antitoxin module
MAQTLGVRLDDDLHREFKVVCVRKGVSMRQVVEALIKEWVAEQKGEVSQAADDTAE